MTSTDTQEESMKLGGGTANGMRALGYQVLPPEPNSDSTCWRMIAPQYPNTEYLAADQAEGWRKAERHWHARNLENVFRRAPAPVPGDMREVVARLEAALTTIAGSHWERFGMDQTDIEDVPDLSAEEAMNVARDALSYDNDQAAALTPHIAADEREAVDAAFHKSWCAVIDLLDRDYITPAKLREAIAPFVAAEILAAEARGAERERARKGTVTTYKRGFGPGDGDSAIEHGAGK